MQYREQRRGTELVRQVDASKFDFEGLCMSETQDLDPESAASGDGRL